MKRFLAVLVLAGVSVNAQTITQTFGTGANVFSIDFVEIGNPGNAADTTGSPNPVGRVDYVYNLGKYEISRDQIEKANSAASLGIILYDMYWLGGNSANRPASGISWYEAARFVNYLNTSQGKQAAYNLDGNGFFKLWDSGQYIGNNKYRHKDAFYFLPSTDEWYKGAYGSPSGTWYNFTTGSDNVPIAVNGGTTFGTAVYAQPTTNGPADVTNAGGLSPYGTMAQGGNVWELIESAYDGINDSESENREKRGGAWTDHTGNLETVPNVFGSFSRDYTSLSADRSGDGFRIAMVPEPSSLSLLLAGLAVLMAGRRRISL